MLSALKTNWKLSVRQRHYHPKRDNHPNRFENRKCLNPQTRIRKVNNGCVFFFLWVQHVLCCSWYTKTKAPETLTLKQNVNSKRQQKRSRQSKCCRFWLSRKCRLMYVSPFRTNKIECATLLKHRSVGIIIPSVGIIIQHLASYNPVLKQSIPKA